MAKLLLVEESLIVRTAFKKLLEETDFEVDSVASYAEAKIILEEKKYDFSVVERILPDAPKGEIIALLNRHDIAPLVFTSAIDEEFFDSFEGAHIVDYILKQKYNNITTVIEKLKQIQANKDTTVLVLSYEPLFSLYLTKNLNLHGFKVITAQNSEDAYAKVKENAEISLIILDDKEPYTNSLEIVEYIRKFKASKELKILALSDKTNTYSISTLLNNGVDDYLIKPFSRKEFYVRVYQNINKLC